MGEIPSGKRTDEVTLTKNHGPRKETAHSHVSGSRWHCLASSPNTALTTDRLDAPLAPSSAVVHADLEHLASERKGRACRLLRQSDLARLHDGTSGTAS